MRPIATEMLCGEGDGVGGRGGGGVAARGDAAPDMARSRPPVPPVPDTLPFERAAGPRPAPAPDAQPEPADCGVGHIHTGTEWVTAITREWDSPEQARLHCRWCPKHECVVSERGTCTVQVVAYLDENSARNFARPGSPAVGGPAVVGPPPPPLPAMGR